MSGVDNYLIVRSCSHMRRPAYGSVIPCDVGHLQEMAEIGSGRSSPWGRHWCAARRVRSGVGGTSRAAPSAPSRRRWDLARPCCPARRTP